MSQQIPARNYRLVNAFDDIVRRKVWEQMLAEPNMCRCEKCFLDTCAIVFNHGFSYFVTTEQGALLTTLPAMSSTKNTELIIAVTEAIRIVKNTPQHDC